MRASLRLAPLAADVPGGVRAGGSASGAQKRAAAAYKANLLRGRNHAIARHRAARGVCRLVGYVPSGVVILGCKILDLGGVDGASVRTSARRLVRGPKSCSPNLQRGREGTHGRSPTLSCPCTGQNGAGGPSASQPQNSAHGSRPCTKVRMRPRINVASRGSVGFWAEHCASVRYSRAKS